MWRWKYSGGDLEGRGILCSHQAREDWGERYEAKLRGHFFRVKGAKAAKSPEVIAAHGNKVLPAGEGDPGCKLLS